MTDPSPPNEVVVALPVAPGRTLGHSWGKAPVVALATVRGGEVVGWEEHEVRWDVAHDEGHRTDPVRRLGQDAVRSDRGLA